MGVPELMKFLSDNRFLKNDKLRGTGLIIDGCNFMMKVNMNHQFGDDYGKLYDRYKQLLEVFRDCKVKPIVVFDGSTERDISDGKRKWENKLEKNCNDGFKEVKPLLLRNVFINALDCLGIRYFTHIFEADGEVAALGKFFGFPVMSNDTDFCFYDTEFITYKEADIKREKDDNGNLYIPCTIFDRTAFLKQYNLQKTHLPLLGAILSSEVADKLYKRFNGDFDAGQGREKIIKCVIDWVGRRTVESALQELKGYGHDDIQGDMIMFEVGKPMSGPLFQNERSQDNIKLYKSAVVEKDDKFKNVPDKIFELIISGKLAKFVPTIIRHGRIYAGFQREDKYQDSCESNCLNLYGNIAGLINHFCGVERVVGRKKVEMFWREGIKEKKEERDLQPNYSLYKQFDLDKIVNENNNKKIELFLTILELNENERNAMRECCHDLFLLSLIYWVKKMKRRQDPLRKLQAVLVMILYKSQRWLTESARPSEKLRELYESVPSEELSDFVKRLENYEKSVNVNKKNWDIRVLHDFSILQTVIACCVQLNYLLNCPFPELEIQNYYCDSLLYGIYAYAENGVGSWRTESERSPQELIEGFPNVLKVYEHLFSRLSREIDGQ